MSAIINKVVLKHRFAKCVYRSKTYTLWVNRLNTLLDKFSIQAKHTDREVKRCNRCRWTKKIRIKNWWDGKMVDATGAFAVKSAMRNLRDFILFY